MFVVMVLDEFDADLDAPGILIEGVKTFSGRKYYNVDGRHRIEKLIDLGKQVLHTGYFISMS